MKGHDSHMKVLPAVTIGTLTAEQQDQFRDAIAEIIARNIATEICDNFLKKIPFGILRECRPEYSIKLAGMVGPDLIYSSQYAEIGCRVAAGETERSATRCVALKYGDDPDRLRSAWRAWRQHKKGSGK